MNDFVAVLTDLDLISEWQIEIRKKNNDPFEVDELVIYACAKDNCDKVLLEKTLKERIATATEVTPNSVVFLSFAEMIKRVELETASKEKRILDSRPK